MRGKHLNPKTNPRKACSRVSRSLFALDSYFTQNELTSVFQALNTSDSLHTRIEICLQPSARFPGRGEGHPNKGRNVGKQFVGETNNENKKRRLRRRRPEVTSRKSTWKRASRQSKKFEILKLNFVGKAGPDMNWNSFLVLRLFPKNWVEATTTTTARQSKSWLA